MIVNFEHTIGFTAERIILASSDVSFETFRDVCHNICTEVGFIDDI